MARYSIPLTHRPTRDGEVVKTAHMPGHTVLELSNHALIAALKDACGTELDPMTLAVVGLSAEFGKEAFVGDTEWDVTISRIGSSSMTVEIDVLQGGERVVHLSQTFVRTSADRTGSQPFSPEQREGLSTLLTS